MRKRILLALSLLALVIAISCQPDVAERSPEIDYDVIGRMHNQGLEAQFELLKSLRDEGSLSRTNATTLLNALEASALSFTTEQNPKLSAQSNALLQENLNKVKVVLAASSTRTPEDRSVHEQLIDDVRANLSENQELYVTKIIDAVTNGSSELSVTLQSLHDLETEIRATCSAEELPVLLSALSVARHSSEYWSANLGKWENEFADYRAKTHQSDTTKKKINWNQAGGADVAGAVSTGILISPVLVVPFIGWGSYLGITGGVSVLASAGTVAMQLLL